MRKLCMYVTTYNLTQILLVHFTRTKLITWCANIIMCIQVDIVDRESCVDSQLAGQVHR